MTSWYCVYNRYRAGFPKEVENIRACFWFFVSVALTSASLSIRLRLRSVPFWPIFGIRLPVGKSRCNLKKCSTGHKNLISVSFQKSLNEFNSRFKTASRLLDIIKHACTKALKGFEKLSGLIYWWGILFWSNYICPYSMKYTSWNKPATLIAIKILFVVQFHLYPSIHRHLHWGAMATCYQWTFFTKPFYRYSFSVHAQPHQDPFYRQSPLDRKTQVIFSGTDFIGMPIYVYFGLGICEKVFRHIH